MFPVVQGLALLTARCAAAAALVAPAFTAPSTGNTFFLNTSYMNFSSAESACAASGGHLASYLSQQEQAEVEQFYIKNGYLLPAFHRCVSGLQVTCLLYSDPGACQQGVASCRRRDNAVSVAISQVLVVCDCLNIQALVS